MRKTALFFLLLTSVCASAQTFKFSTLYSFKNNGRDPAYPSAPLIIDSTTGTLYGTSANGGSTAFLGSVFKVTKKGVLTVLHGFQGGNDGETPKTSLIRDTEGNLYGTTYPGGSSDQGVVFKVTTAGQETILYNFTDGSDGTPTSSLVLDSKGNLYGTAQGDSTPGLVYKLDTGNNFSILYSFCIANPSCQDGELPASGLIIDGTGNLYGITEIGGGFGGGVVFEVTQLGVETVLHSFAGVSGDGFLPFGNLGQDAKGNLYGVTLCGGINDPNFTCVFGGTLFMQPEAGGTETVLYNFCSEPSCTDGYDPQGPVARDKAGNLYGTAPTFSGATVVWEVNTTGKETVLYKFNKTIQVVPGIIIDSTGNLYGMTHNGGSALIGTVYKLTKQ